MNRRNFIKKVAAGVGGLTVLGARGQGAAPAKKPLRVALIGCGGRGCGELLPELCKERVVALADADRRCIEAALAKAEQSLLGGGGDKALQLADQGPEFSQKLQKIDVDIGPAPFFQRGPEVPGQMIGH